MVELRFVLTKYGALSAVISGTMRMLLLLVVN